MDVGRLFCKTYRKYWQINLIFMIVLAILGILIVLEYLTRFTKIHPNDPFGAFKKPACAYIPKLFPSGKMVEYTYHKNFWNGLEEGKRVVLKYNNEGLLGEDILTPKPVNEYRIVLLGDSTIQCIMQDQKTASLRAVLENKLKQFSDKNIKVYVAAMIRPDINDLLAMLCYKIAHLEADCVVVTTGTSVLWNSNLKISYEGRKLAFKTLAKGLLTESLLMCNLITSMVKNPFPVKVYSSGKNTKMVVSGKIGYVCPPGTSTKEGPFPINEEHYKRGLSSKWFNNKEFIYKLTCFISKSIS